MASRLCCPMGRRKRWRAEVGEKNDAMEDVFNVLLFELYFFYIYNEMYSQRMCEKWATLSTSWPW